MSKNREEEVVEQAWMRVAAEKVAREGKSLLVVVDEMGINGMRPQEIDQVYRSKKFQGMVREERNRFALEVAGNPLLKKDTLVGFMMIAVEKLMLEGHWDKALEGLQKLAKLAGWQGADAINIFSELKPRDFEELRKKVGVESSLAGAAKTFSN